MPKNSAKRWTTDDASELYGIDRWGNGYFSISRNGNVLVHPDRNPDRSIDISELIDRLKLRGVELPILLRFDGILKDRLRQLKSAFATAIEGHDYTGTYRCVYPIKVNQQHRVLEKLIKYSSAHGFGLEAGSKPELLAVVAMANPDTPIICNGFKDATFIRMVMLAQKIGRTVIPVVEKYSELDLILKQARSVGVRPRFGMRIKLAASGAGRWKDSGGVKSKFGLTTTEVLRGLETLKKQEMADCFCLLHFHLGSQITNIRRIKQALIESARIYANLKKRGAGLQSIDIGGGLGVDYDGSQTDSNSSINYSLQEYANDVIYHFQTVCDEEDVPHPDIISESGRTIAAYYSVLVFNVLGVAQHDEQIAKSLPDNAELPLRTLAETFADLNARNLLESLHDAQTAYESVLELFGSGHLPLDRRSIAENLYWAICDRIRLMAGHMDHFPEEFDALNRTLCDTYFANFSLFRSIPDSWAIRQLFPIMPVHRLDSRPDRHAVIGDVTCDSDGKIDQFIGPRDVRQTLNLHQFDGTPYYLGAFLVGAYQEILGDIHNLFGDTNAAHVGVLANGKIAIEAVVKGDSVCDVLRYVRFDKTDLIHRLQSAVEQTVRDGAINHHEANDFLKSYEEALAGYTYLKESGV
ncbi:MAG: biosynthetic arginine decarboxylase [Fuerstiella sp.]|nr:biosynthetic arginine decarboxylase [Fuerstiella sp.]